MTKMLVKTLTDVDSARWDGFVESHPEASFFHKAGWKQVIERAFGHNSYFLFAEHEGRVEGILPLVHVKSFLFGNNLVSTPFCVYGGIVAQSEAARQALDDKASSLARELGVESMELRNRCRLHEDRPYKKLYVTFRKEIDPQLDNNLKAIPRKQRAIVRKGIKSGMVSVIDKDINRFYDAYAESVRNLGTPVFSKKYFQILHEVFADNCQILTIEHQGQPVSSVLSFLFRDEILPYYGGGVDQARHLKANDFMYWEVMRRACEAGIRVFDYGRSKEGTGSYRFKKHWGFEPEQLYYEFDLVSLKEMPDLNPLNPKYQMFIKLWKHLPVPVSKQVGPYLSRFLG